MHRSRILGRLDPGNRGLDRVGEGFLGEKGQTYIMNVG